MVKAVFGQTSSARVVKTLILALALVGLAPGAMAGPANAPFSRQPLACVTPVFVNEFHYDNSGTDTGEFIEVAGPAGTDLSGWTLVLYNGNGGAPYDTISLSGTIPDQDNGYGTLSFSALGLQNGAPDGFALVNDSNGVEQFLSYEGSFTAVGGPADGLVSTDVGVDEEPAPPAGNSLQLIGTGECPEDFTWSGPSDDSPGSVNDGQSFVGGDAAPYVSSTIPTDGATGVATNANIVVNFSEDVNVAGSWYNINCSSSGVHTAVVSGGPQSFTLDPDVDFTDPEDCTVTIYASQVTDQDTDDPPDNMELDYVWSFSVGPPSACATELFFSEYVEGSSYNKALEIVNATGAAVDLSAGNYWVELYRNGSPTPEAPMNMNGVLSHEDVYVLCHTSAGVEIQNECDLADGGLSFNGDDALALVRDGTILDVIGRIGEDPGSYWDGGGDLRTQDRTLRRKSIITAGDPDGTDPFEPELVAEWDGYPLDTFDGLGSHTVECGEIAPYVADTSPSHGASGVATNANIDITFSEAVDVVGSWYAIDCAGSGSHAATVSGGPQSFTLNPTSDFIDCEQCTVTIYASQVTDQDVDDPPDNMEQDYAFSFSIACGCNAICQIQGYNHQSPCNGQGVTNIWGIVTAVDDYGFWLEDAGCDASPYTSNGMYVYRGLAGSKPNVGDEVLAGGTVDEYQPGAPSDNNLTITELASSSWSRQSTGNPLPVTVVGAGGRIPPNTITDNDSSGSVNPTLHYDPDEDGLDFWESLEGMRIQVNDPYVVAGTNAYGEIGISPDNCAFCNSLSPRSAIVRQENDWNPERIIIDDVIVTPPPDVVTGATFDAPIIGVMHYNFGMYKLFNPNPLPSFSGSLSREVGPSAGADQISMATFNVENLDPNDGDGDADVADGKFVDLADIIVNHLNAPDILLISEIQDNSGSTDNGVTAANQTWDLLITEIENAGAPAGVYDWRDIEPQNNQDGGQLGGNIRVGFLFRTDRGLAFVDRGSCDYNDPVSVQAGPQLSCSPGRIDPNNSAFDSSRKPLAAEFTYTDSGSTVHTLFVVANHFNSKFGDSPDFGILQPPVRSSETQRTGQAEVVNAFVDDVLAIDANTLIVVGGDLNDFEFASTIDVALRGDPPVLNNLIMDLPALERYTYVYQCNSQVLDHILVSDALHVLGGGGQVNQTVVSVDIVHVNAEFPFSQQASDHDPLVTILGFVPTAVKLASFDGQPAAGGILLTWETESEYDNLGFNLYRSISADVLGEPLNEGLIPSKSPGEGLGASYEFLDGTAVSGETYYYTLEDVDASGRHTQHGPVVLTLWRAYLPLVWR